MDTPVLHYIPIKNNSSAQKNVKKSKPGSQTDFDSIVFYIPVEGLNSINSVVVEKTACDTATSPKVLSASNPALTSTTHPVQIFASGPGTPKLVFGASASPVATAVSSPARPVASSVPSESPTSSRSVAAASFLPTANFASSPKSIGILSESNVSPVAKQLVNKPQVKRQADALVSTIVFFDLETTGLAHEIGKANVQITEISMIAMARKDFQNSTSTELKDIRVIQKICLCTRPRASISPGAAKVTGLQNSNLIEQHPFDPNAAAVITTFLNHLPKPVCLIAHNGACYDFPLLKAEFDRLSIPLSSDILIADTLKAFRALGVPVFPPGRKIAKSVKYGRQGQISYALDNLHLYFFNKKPIGSHSSEGDCIALAKVCHQMKDLMLPWIDENCSTIDNVVPMW